MTKKDISTLIPDIYDIFLKPHTVSDKNLQELGDNVKDAIVKSIKEASEHRQQSLRMSNIGRKDRQLWFDINTPVEPAKEEKQPEKYLKFLFGSIMEQLLVFLIKESGHTITHFQEELEIDGVLGHTDGAIDGIPTDIKTASNYQFGTKFKNGGLLQRNGDTFGYV
jgi:hypothetical protein